MSDNQFNLGIIQFGYGTRFYCPIDKAIPLLQFISSCGLLFIDTDYKNGKSTEFAKPLDDKFVTFHLANPATAFARIRAGEEREKE